VFYRNRATHAAVDFNDSTRTAHVRRGQIQHDAAYGALPAISGTMHMKQRMSGQHYMEQPCNIFRRPTRRRITLCLPERNLLEEIAKLMGIPANKAKA
jgi:hypothetical protein